MKCKKCINEYNKQYQKDNAENIKEYRKQYQKEYRKNNAESIKQYNKQYQKDNAESIKEHRKEYRKNNAESIKEYRKQYYIDNVERIKEHSKQYRKDNAEHYKEYYKEYNKNNAERVKKHNKEYNTKKVQEALQQIKIEVESNPNKYNYITGKKIFGVIYLVCNIKSDKYYIGQTITGFDNRYPKGWLYEHSKKDTVKHDMELYGEDSFKYTKIFKVTYSQYELDKLEVYYIDYYDSYENGYNETRGNIFTNRGKEI